MGGPGSGRKPGRRRPVKLPKDRSAEPVITDDPRTVAAHARWCVAQLLAGKLDPSVNKQVVEHHRTCAAIDRSLYQQGEVETLRKMFAEAKTFAAARAKAAVEGRYDGDTGKLAEFEVADDGAVAGLDGKAKN